MTRDKDKIKVDILTTLATNRKHPLEIGEIKASIRIDKNEQDTFEQAVKELEKERKIQKCVRLP